MKVHNKNDFKNPFLAIKKFAESLDKKGRQSCLKLHKQLKKETKALVQQFNEFLKTCQQIPKVCQYWDSFIELTPMLHNLISVTGKGTVRVRHEIGANHKSFTKKSWWNCRSNKN